MGQKLQGSVATHLRCGGVVNNQVESVMKSVKIGEYLAKLQART